MAEEIGLRAVIDLTNFNKGVKQYNAGIGKMDKSTSSLAGVASKSFSGIGKSLASVGAIAGGAALAGVGALAVGVTALGTVSVKTAISFESAFAGVLKTTDGLTNGIGVLNEEGQKLRQGFVDLSKEVPLAFEELAAIGELGGQLGIGKEALLDFTETIAALGVSTNLSTEEAATAIARMGNIYQVTAADMGMNTQQVGSAIVALGNNFATTERDITNFATRIAGAGQIVGLSQADILGIGAAFSSVGVEAEAGGTAVQKVLLGINNAVNGTATGFVDNTKAIERNVGRLQDLNAESARLEAVSPGLQQAMLDQYDAFIAAGGSAEEFGRQLGDKTRQKAFETATAIRDLEQQTQLLRQSQGQPIDAGQLQKFAKVAGVSADEFSALWEKDASKAFQMFVEGLGKEGDNAANVLDELGLADQRLVRGFLSLAGAGDLLGQAIDTSNEAFMDNTALQNEAAQRYATTQSQLAILKNNFRAIGDTIGSRFLPFLNQAIDIVKRLINDAVGPLTDILDQLFQGNFAQAGELISANLQLAWNSIRSSIAMWGQNAPGLIGEVVRAITTGDWDNLGNIVGAKIFLAWNSIKTQFVFWGQDAQRIITEWLPQLADTFLAWATGEGSVAAGELGTTLGTAMTEGLIALLGGDETSTSVGAELLKALGMSVLKIIGGLITIGADLVAGILEGIINALTGGNFQADTVSTMAATWQGIADNLMTILNNIGWDMVWGIIKGIASAQQDLNQAVLDLLMSGIENLKSFLGIGSPSTLFAQFGTDMIQGLINGLLSMGGQLAETIGSIFGDLFSGENGLFGGLFNLFGGGGDGGEQDTNPFTGILTTITSLKEMLTTTLPETFTAFFTLLTEQVLAITESTLLPFNQLWIDLYILHLPTLQAVWLATQAIIQSGLLMLIATTNMFIQQIIATETQITSLKDTGIAAFAEIKEGIEDASKAIEKKLLPILTEAIKRLERLTYKAHQAAAAVSSVAGSKLENSQGMGFKHGLGFQNGLGLGFKVPQGFPNDSFGPFYAQSGEEMLITPRGTSIQDLVFSRLSSLLGSAIGGDRITNSTNNYNFELNVSTVASSQAVIQQYDVMRALI